MREDIYLDIYLYPFELATDIKKILMIKLKERYLFKEFDRKMITNIELNDLKNIPLSKSTINSI